MDHLGDLLRMGVGGARERKTWLSCPCLLCRREMMLPLARSWWSVSLNILILFIKLLILSCGSERERMAG